MDVRTVVRRRSEQGNGRAVQQHLRLRHEPTSAARRGSAPVFRPPASNVHETGDSGSDRQVVVRLLVHGVLARPRNVDPVVTDVGEDLDHAGLWCRRQETAWHGVSQGAHGGQRPTLLATPQLLGSWCLD